MKISTNFVISDTKTNPAYADSVLSLLQGPLYICSWLRKQRPSVVGVRPVAQFLKKNRTGWLQNALSALVVLGKNSLCTSSFTKMKLIN
jgi:hypothetical protein